MSMRKAMVPWLLVGLSLPVAVGAQAGKDEVLAAPKVIAAIEAAVAAYPGEIKDVEIDDEGGKLVAEVEIVGADGSKREVRVDADSGQVLQ